MAVDQRNWGGIICIYPQVSIGYSFAYKSIAKTSEKLPAFYSMMKVAIPFTLAILSALSAPTLANWDTIENSTPTKICSGSCTCTGASSSVTDGTHLTEICTKIFSDPCKTYTVGGLTWSPSTLTPCSVYYKPRSVDECKQGYNTGFSQWHTSSNDCAGQSEVFMLGFVKALNGVIGSGGVCATVQGKAC